MDERQLQQGGAAEAEVEGGLRFFQIGHFI